MLNLKANLNVWQINENVNMALAAAKSLGCLIQSVDARTIQNKTEYLILGVVWQLVRLYMVKSIDLKHVPEITRLLQEGEELHELQKLPPEKILIRWLNYHLEKDGTDRRATNLGKDLADGEIYIRVINQLDKNSISKDLLNEDDKVKRGQGIIKGAEKLGVTSAIKPSDIASGNVKLNTLFTSLIFNAKHGLEELA